MSNEGSMKDFLEDYDVKRIQRGDILKGKIIEVNDKEVAVNINYAFDGLISKEELTYEGLNPLDVVKKDDEIEVYVISPNDGEGYVALSRIKALSELEREEIKEAFKNEKLINVRVKEEVKGGLVAYYGSVRIFIPASLVSVERVVLDKYINKELEVKIIELDFRNKKVVASRRVIEEEILKQQKTEKWATLKSGEKTTGIVTKLAKFGAFVDLGGVQGLIHINDLSWERVNKPEEVVKVGDRVEVFILDINKEKEKISLMLKDVEKEPWKLHIEAIKENSIYEGKVVRLTAFGAFVQILPGIEGLVHISEITDENIAKPSDVLKEGQTVKVKVIKLDKEQKKIGLSIKEAIEGNSDFQKYNDDEDGVTLGELFSNLKL